MGTSEQSRRRARLVFNGLVLLVSFVVFFQRDMRIGTTSTFDNFAIHFLASVQSGLRHVRERVRGVFTHYLNNAAASYENERLRVKITELERHLFEQKEIVEENKRLKAFLKLEGTSRLGRVVAQVVASDSGSDYRVIRINKGKSSGIRLQSPVVTPEGLVGYVYRLTSHFADVLTILDSNNRVDALVQRTRTHGIIEGDSSSKTIMKYVSRTGPVILRDRVITSGLGNIYPKGIKVGIITRIEKESYGIVQKIVVTPSVNFDRLEEVGVLIDQGDQRKEKEWKALDDLERSEVEAP